MQIEGEKEHEHEDVNVNVVPLHLRHLLHKQPARRERGGGEDTGEDIGRLVGGGGGGNSPGVQWVDAPVLNVGGKCFPVQIHQLEFLNEHLGSDGFPLIKPPYYKAAHDAAAAHAAHTAHASEFDLGEDGGPASAADAADAVAAAAAMAAVAASVNAKLPPTMFAAAAWILSNLHLMEDGVSMPGVVPEGVLAARGEGEGGSVLIFVPGVAELSDLQQRLVKFEDHLEVIPLHGQLEDEDQERIFAPAPAGKRKVIIGTNIAESSVTVTDITYVIDLGLEKLPYFDARSGTDALLLKHCSRASAKQRSGRAGRTAEGVCFRLYSTDFMEGPMMPPFAPPEMLRCSLINLVLKAKIIDHTGAKRFLLDALQPPPLDSINTALHQLRFQGAIANDDSVTRTGLLLSLLPVDVNVGRLLLLGRLFGTLDATAIVASAISLHHDVFLQPFTGGGAGRGAKGARPTGGKGDGSADEAAAAAAAQVVAEAEAVAEAELADEEMRFFAPKLQMTYEGDRQSDPLAAAAVSLSMTILGF